MFCILLCTVVARPKVAKGCMLITQAFYAKNIFRTPSITSQSPKDKSAKLPETSQNLNLTCRGGSRGKMQRVRDKTAKKKETDTINSLSRSVTKQSLCHPKTIITQWFSHYKSCNYLQAHTLFFFVKNPRLETTTSKRRKIESLKFS